MLLNKNVRNKDTNRCSIKLQTCTSEPNRRAIAQQESREYRRSIAQQLRRKLERAKRARTIPDNEIFAQFQLQNIRYDLGHMDTQLFEDQDEQCKEFHANIRQYNAAHAFTSLGVNIDQTILKLQEILQEHHAFYPIYQQAHEILSQIYEEGVSKTDIAVHLHFNVATDRCCYNLLTLNKIAVILPGDGSEPKAMCDIVIRLQEGLLERIYEAYPAYLPLHYMLFFTHEKLGWHAELHHTLIDEYG
ncbi:14592_t:CDS:2 [Cetraspora pellucida]|uniref:14592_t:CDS:1 n=1 Tax=Cetraspora pellucida TaxID=1433469 RepID=A0A9N9E234_9GLOM|nr:14592_t:CDS:2 [Cetraspora pellucida]